MTTSILVYGVVIDPVEDSTPDNLRALAHLMEIASGRSMRSSLCVSEGVLKFGAEGSLEDAVGVAREASRSAIYPDVEVDGAASKRMAISLLKGTTGVLVHVKRPAPPGDRGPGNPREQQRSSEAPEDYVSIRRRPDGAPATEEQARSILRKLGYTGAVEPVGPERKGGEILFRVTLPHYGLPPSLEALDGAIWEVNEHHPPRDDAEERRKA